MDADWKKMETLNLMIGMMNHLALIGARKEMRKLGKTEILLHVKDDPAKIQLFLEYVYVGNRIGGGLQEKILDAKTILRTWSSQWWIDLWKKVKPLVEKERKRRNNKKLYSNFEWFVKQLEKKAI